LRPAPATGSLGCESKDAEGVFVPRHPRANRP
jgi:hypothetical protein